MGRYIEWDDVVKRYNDLAQVGDSNLVDGTYIQYAEFEVDARLATLYSVPFSSNNATVKDLSIDLAYLKAAPTRSANYKRIKEWVDERFKMLCGGKMSMITDSGDVAALAGNKAVPFSSTSGSPQVFLSPTSCEVHQGLGIMPFSEDLT